MRYHVWTELADKLSARLPVKHRNPNSASTAAKPTHK